MKWFYALLAALLGDGSPCATLLFGGAWLASEADKKNRKHDKQSNNR